MSSRDDVMIELTVAEIKRAPRVRAGAKGVTSARRRLPKGVFDFVAYRRERIAEDERFAPKKSGLTEDQERTLDRLLAEERAKKAIENRALAEYQAKQKAGAARRLSPEKIEELAQKVSYVVDRILERREMQEGAA